MNKLDKFVVGLIVLLFSWIAASSGAGLSWDASFYAHWLATFSVVSFWIGSGMVAYALLS